MLLLIFYVGDERYAIESRRIVEVIPMVELKKLHHTSEYLSGLFNYRNRIVPVIDLCYLLKGTSCRRHLSTRIIMVNYLNGDNTHVLGIIAERVTETINKSESELIETGIKIEDAPYLGKVIIEERGMIQCLYIDNILPNPQKEYLLSQVG